MQKRHVTLLLALLLLLIGAVAITASAQDEAVELEVWTFVPTHARWYEAQAERYREEVNENFTLNVVEIAYSDLHDRLLISLQAGGEGAPDIADVEQGAFGNFLRSGDPGFVDLSAWLEEGGYLEDFVSERLALYSYGDAIYGIEHALTPVVLYYRQDIWAEYGYDPAEFVTWDEFTAAAAEIAADRGSAAIPVFADLHQILLRQRGGDYFNAEGAIAFGSDLSIDTMNWLLAQMDAGVAMQMPGGDADWAAFNDGTFISMIGADWYAGFFKDNAPDLAGKWRVAALPAWEEGGSQTSVWGGTGATIVETSENVDAAWDFLSFAMLSVEGNVERFELTTLYPPYIPAMSSERLLQPDPYFGDQVIGEVFAAVAPTTPPQFQSPYRTFLTGEFSAAFQDILDRNVSVEDAFADIVAATEAEMAFDE